MRDDRHSMTPMPDNDDAALAGALRALPLATPQRSAWASLQRELAQSQPVAPQRRTLPKWIALAATVLAAIAGVRLLQPPASPETSAATTAPSEQTLALIEQSQHLDALIATLDARSVPIDAPSAMASAELEDLIGLTDLQLNTATRDDEAQALWSRRVDLMTRLADTRTTARFDALSDNGGAYLQNANYRID